jgi:hypothetical protein
MGKNLFIQLWITLKLANIYIIMYDDDDVEFLFLFLKWNDKKSNKLFDEYCRNIHVMSLLIFFFSSFFYFAVIWHELWAIVKMVEFDRTVSAIVYF